MLRDWLIKVGNLWFNTRYAILNFKYDYYMNGNSISIDCGNETIWETKIIGKVNARRHRMSLFKIE